MAIMQRTYGHQLQRADDDLTNSGGHADCRVGPRARITEGWTPPFSTAGYMILY